MNCKLYVLVNFQLSVEHIMTMSYLVIFQNNEKISFFESPFMTN
jgi:hypothetical protein